MFVWYRVIKSHMVLSMYKQSIASHRDVTIIDINRLSVAKAFRFSIIDSQISLSIVFDIDNMWKLRVKISLLST